MTQLSLLFSARPGRPEWHVTWGREGGYECLLRPRGTTVVPNPSASCLGTQLPSEVQPAAPGPHSEPKGQRVFQPGEELWCLSRQMPCLWGCLTSWGHSRHNCSCHFKHQPPGSLCTGRASGQALGPEEQGRSLCALLSVSSPWLLLPACPSFLTPPFTC